MDMEFDAITASLGNNGVDIGIAGMTINATRKAVVNFSDPYYTDAYQVILAMESDTRFDACQTTEDVLKILKELGNK
jgi:ABC-type amino acid transport substrate-binding protein